MRTPKLNALVAISLCIFVASLTVKAQTTGFGCASLPVKVIKDARTVVLRCSTVWPDPNLSPVLVVDVFESKEGAKTNPGEWIKPFPGTVTVRRGPNDFTLTLTLSSDMRPGIEYVFALRSQATPATQ